jgi:methylisocitrate lyase
MTDTSPGARLRAAWAEETIAIPGVWSPLVARLAEQTGFRAVYLSGAALSALHAVPDIGILTLNDFVDAARAITQSTVLPLLCDADTGFGETVNVERTVRLFEDAGVAGIHLEDQQLPKRCGHLSGKALVPAPAMVSKIRAAVAARRDPSFVIMARTDARGVEGFDAAVARAREYVAAGADAIFPEALETPEEFARFASEIRAPLLANMTEFGKSPSLSVAELGKLGYRMVLFPVTTLRSALHAARRTLLELKQHGRQQALLPEMLTRQELYDLLGYQEYEARDRAYFGGAVSATPKS